MWFSCFPILPGSAEAQAIWGGTVKRLLIAYFIGNISAKKCQNPFMCVKVIASQRWDVFWDTVYTSFCRRYVVTLALDCFISEIVLDLCRQCYFCTYPSRLSPQICRCSPRLRSVSSELHWARSLIWANYLWCYFWRKLTYLIAVHKCNRQMDGRTDRQTGLLQQFCTLHKSASCSKNNVVTLLSGWFGWFLN